MIDPDEKYKRRGKGYYPIEKEKTPGKHKYPDNCFNPDQNENWLFNDDKEYKKKRKSKRRK